MNSRVRTAGRRAVAAAAAARSSLRTDETSEQVKDVDRLVRQLTSRVAVLEVEVEEARRLNRRLAELTDIVQELLLPVAQRDEPKLAETLQRYSAQL